jgi:transcriptional regulator with XRE-family HTH domain
MARTLPKPGQRVHPLIQDLASLGQLVRHRRLELSLRIDDAAHACGVSSNVLSRLENGGSVGVDRLLMILAGLGLSMLVARKGESLRLAPMIQLEEPSPRPHSTESGTPRS